VYERPVNESLRSRLGESRRFIQVVLGPRQVGKTTSVRTVVSRLSIPSHYAAADTATLESTTWIEEQWAAARALWQDTGAAVILALDEVQKVGGWSSWVKRLWDDDSHAGRDIRVVITGSSHLLISGGLTESLAGRFEVIPFTHWTWPECRDAFGWSLDQFIFFGGYPGAAPLIGDEERWRAYILDSIVETTVSRDVLLTTRVDKPALLRRVFDLACMYAGHELTYENMVAGLHEAGNTTTVAHYLDLLDGAGLVGGLQKYSGAAARRRRSTPKLIVHNTALANAVQGRTFAECRADSELWGRLVESAVGAHLIAAARTRRSALYYWRTRIRGQDAEVDYVTVGPDGVTGIEVKSGADASLRGLDAFRNSFPDARTVLVGPGGTPLEEFLAS
jgi:hypothetical protein